MAVEWTTHTIVLTYIKGAGTSLSQAEIEAMIEQTEGYFKVLLKLPTTFTFSASNKYHLLLRDIVTLRVALRIIASTLQSFYTLQEAGMAADILIDQYKEAYAELRKSYSAQDFIIERT
jgi:hypothetical protein